MSRLVDDIEKIKSYLDQPGAKVALCAPKSRHAEYVINELARIMPRPKKATQWSIEWPNGARLFVLSTLRPDGGRGVNLNAAFVFKPTNLTATEEQHERHFLYSLAYMSDCEVHSYYEL